MPALKSPDWNLSREIWPQDSIYEEVYKAGAFLGMVDKDGTFGEVVRHIAVGTGTPQGAGAGFGDAKAGKTGSTAKVFAFSPKRYYCIFSIDNMLIEQAKISGSTICKPYARESEGALLTWTRDMSAFMYGNGGGAFGRITNTAIVPGAGVTTVTLLDPQKARFFQENMRVWFSATDGTSGTAKPGVLTVAGVEDDDDVSTGVITFTTPITDGIPTAAASDYLFRAGNFGNVINGLNAWLPSSKPGTNGVPASFLGVDRTLSARKYSGFRIRGVNLTMYEAGMKAATALVNASAKPDTWLMNTNDWNNFRASLEGAGNLVRTTAPAAGIGDYKPGMSYDAITLKGPRGEIKTVADPDCPVGRSYMLQLGTWSLASVGPMVRLIDGERTEENSDSKESRFAGYNELENQAPGFNATIQHVTGA